MSEKRFDFVKAHQDDGKKAGITRGLLNPPVKKLRMSRKKVEH